MVVIAVVVSVLTGVCVFIAGKKCTGFETTPRTPRTVVTSHQCRPRLRYRTPIVPTAQLSTTNEAVLNNDSSSVAVPLDNIQSEFELQPVYKDAEFSSQDAPPSYTAAAGFPMYEPPSPSPGIYI